MTPYKEKPLVTINPKLQFALLMLIVAQGFALVFKMFTFTADYSKNTENHERRITNIEQRQDRFDDWKEAITQNAYFRQGRPIQNQTP